VNDKFIYIYQLLF